jgi:hypothetical protein
MSKSRPTSDNSQAPRPATGRLGALDNASDDGQPLVPADPPGVPKIPDEAAALLEMIRRDPTKTAMPPVKRQGVTAD